ncbi:MAG: NAD(P)-dependent oxidoreductase [Lentisphaerae bacterium]|nr:NAD(P)-dependent oxidoreductase [Lentisphaerota bacterium]
MKILVTGGTGFTGSRLVERLLAHGHETLVLDNQKGIAFDDLEKQGAKITIGSVTDRDLLETLIPGCEVIFHLAAAFRRINLPKSVYWNVNVDGMRSLLEVARDNAVRRVVYCSTQGVHGNIDNPPGNEDSPIKPEDYYQYTKYQGEKVCAEFIKEGMDIVTLRPTAIYGPGDPARFFMIFNRVKKGLFPFFGKGTALYHPVYIDNFVDAFLLAMDKPEVKGRTYIIADEHYYTIKEIVLEVAKVMDAKLTTIHVPFMPMYLFSALVEFLYKPLPADPPLFRRRMDWFRQNRAFTIERAKNELGYKPAVDLSTGLQRTFQWYKENGYL